MAEFWRTGHAPEDAGMLGDARAALRWARSQAPGLPVVLVGYSFGAAAAVRLLNEDAVAGAVLIAPTLRQHDYSPAAARTTPPLLVIYSDNDFATPLGVTETWLATVDAQSRCIPGGDHFFLGRERDVAGACTVFASRVRRQAEAQCT
jgi:alpha/beta superfamily hydrolase